MYHNTAVVFDADGALLGLYRKMHIPDDPLYFEKYYFTPGDIGFRTFDTRFGRIGVLVCWDQWFPEAARLTALHGAEVLLYPTAIGWHPREKEEFGDSQHEAWELIQRAARHRQRRLRGGRQPRRPRGRRRTAALEFWGSSFVMRPVRRGAGPGRARTGRSWSSRRATGGGWRTCAATGRSCATGASTLMAI